MRRIDRKLDIQRGMALTYDDLTLLVASGAYAKLQDANRQYLERQCQEHVARSHSTSEEHMPSTPGQGATSKSSGTIPNESASEALARAQATLRPGALPSIGSTSRAKAGGPPARRAVNPSTAATS